MGQRKEGYLTEQVNAQQLVELAMSLVNTDLKLQCQNWAIQLEKQSAQIMSLTARVAHLENSVNIRVDDHIEVWVPPAEGVTR